jgi:hypothetical protein
MRPVRLEKLLSNERTVRGGSFPFWFTVAIQWREVPGWYRVPEMGFRVTWRLEDV